LKNPAVLLASFSYNYLIDSMEALSKIDLWMSSRSKTTIISTKQANIFRIVVVKLADLDSGIFLDLYYH